MLLIPSLKNKTKNYPIEILSDPIDFYLPLDAYRGEMQPIVTIGQRVLKYECLAESTGVISSRIHAPISGVVKAITQTHSKRYIHLENDFQDTISNLSPVNIESLTLTELIDVLRINGIEGAGGSQFPTHLKYCVTEGQIHTLIINGVECEPYLSADAALMKEKTFELLKTAQLLKSVLKAKRLVFVLEKQNADIKKKLREISREHNFEVDFCIVPDTYPQGGELQVIKSVTGIELKKGDRPSSQGVLVNNVGTLWAIHQAIFEGIPHIERVVTVSGNKSEKRGNYWIKIGTRASHVLSLTQNTSDVEKYSLVLGGAMMGKTVDIHTTVTTKGSGGILILNKEKNKAENCIKCGDCVDVCPQHLMPLEFVRFAADSNTKALKEFNLQSCIECGACAYVCPSNVPLMESIFKGKKLI